jgi:hypothetical protein
VDATERRRDREDDEVNRTDRLYGLTLRAEFLSES